MGRWLFVAVLVAASAGMMSGVADAQAKHEFRVSFRVLADQIPEVVGQPLEAEHSNPANGDYLQQSTGGLMVWRKADERTLFTDGRWTWAGGPQGVQKRLNGDRFAWESDEKTPLPFLTATAAPSPSWLRTMAAPVPHLGGSLDTIVASRGQLLAQDRMELLFASLREEMAAVREGAVDKRYLESEEWADLVARALEAAARTRESERIRLYARVLRAAVVVQDRTQGAPEEYLDALSDLGPREMEVARALFRQQQDPSSNPKESELGWVKRRGWDHLQADCPSIPKEDFPFLLSRMQRTGLIREVTGSYYDYPGGVYTITESFRKLVRYVGTLD